MSFPVLALAAEAVHQADWPFDEEVGFGIVDIAHAELLATWALYRAEAGPRLVVAYADPVGDLVEALRG